MTIGNKKGNYLVWGIRKGSNEVVKLGKFLTKAQAETYQGLAGMDDFEEEWDLLSGTIEDFKKFVRNLKRKR